MVLTNQGGMILAVYLLRVRLRAMVWGAGVLLIAMLSTWWSSGCRPLPPPAPLLTKAVASELAEDTTTIWLVPADQPEVRKAVAKIQHQAGYGIRASVSPNSTTLVYTVLPVDSGTMVEKANLWVVGLDGTNPKMLQEGVDLRSTPVWSPGGRKVAFRRSIEDQVGQTRTELWQVEVASGEAKRLVADEEAMGLYSIGWDKEGKKLYYARIAEEGTTLWEVDEAAARPNAVLPLSEGVARDLRLSPDGLFLAFSHPHSLGNEVEYRVEVVNLASKTRQVVAAGSNDHFAPVWRPRGQVLTVSSQPGEVVGQGAVVEWGVETKASTVPFAAPVDGFDVPLHWSPQGDYLAVKTFQGETSRTVRGESLAILSTSDGKRIPVVLNGYAEFIGWVVNQ